MALRKRRHLFDAISSLRFDLVKHLTYRSLRRQIGMLLLVGLFSSNASPQSSTRPAIESVSVQLDNDVLLFGQENEDRNYTMGLAVSLTGPWVRDTRLNAPRRWLQRRVGFIQPEDQAYDPALSNYQMQFGISAFTPDQLEIAGPIPEDRPYANIHYLITSEQHVRSDRSAAITSELSIGILGLNTANWFQTRWHQFLRDDTDERPFDPQGWHLEISEGGEPTARYTVSVQHRLKDERWYDLQYSAEGSVGYYTNAAARAAFRVGRRASPWWSFRAAPIRENQVAVNTAFDGTAPSENFRRWELFGWAGVGITAWAYNALLQGQFRDSPVTVSSSDVERLVGEIQYGVTGGFAAGRWWHSLTYAHARRSPEFETSLRRSHSWGGLYYTVRRAYR